MIANHNKCIRTIQIQIKPKNGDPEYPKTGYYIGSNKLR